MYFQVKITLKNNDNYIFKYTTTEIFLKKSDK
jgi:hypothetical protein